MSIIFKIVQIEKKTLWKNRNVQVVGHLERVYNDRPGSVDSEIRLGNWKVTPGSRVTKHCK